MASKPIIIKQTLAHDVIIKELNVQGGKANVQGGMIMHHLSEWCPSITKCNVLHQMLNKVWGALSKVWASCPSPAIMTISVK
jgi:hypothetical protein